MALGFLKKLAKTPKFLRPLLGNSWVDELGAGAGFVLGGPAGAAAGSALGTGAVTGRPVEALKSGAKAGLTAASLGSLGGANAGANVAGTAATGPGGLSLTPVVARGSQVASSAAPGILGRAGGVARRALGYLKDNPDVAFRALEAVGDARAAAREDRIQDDELERVRKREAARRGILSEMNQSFNTGDVGNPYRNRNLGYGR